MNSCLYKATVMHNRLAPKKHRFNYSVFTFYVDLDELGYLHEMSWMISRNRFNLFSFYDSEHLQLPLDNPDKTKTVKENIITYLKSNGFDYNGEKIFLLTNFSFLGYNFNPVSFYFVVGENNTQMCAIAEVSNTFGEMKPYFLGPECLQEGVFKLNTTKYFYVSPFISHDSNFDFQLRLPAEKLNIRIDTIKDEKRFFISTLTGVQKQLRSANLLWYCFRFPFITLKIITLIHWNALWLWLKKIRYYKKAEFPDLQREVYRKYRETN